MASSDEKIEDFLSAVAKSLEPQAHQMAIDQIIYGFAVLDEDGKRVDPAEFFRTKVAH